MFYKYHHYFLFIVLCCCYTQSFYHYCLFSYQKDWQQQQVVVGSFSDNDNTSFYQESYVAPQLNLSKNHVSSISPLNGEDIACVWYGGSDEGHEDVCIYYSSYQKGIWSQPANIMGSTKCAQELERYIRKIGNPVIFKTQDKIWLFYASVSMGGWSMTSLNCIYSSDKGKTWSKSQKLYLNPFLNIASNVKNKPTLLENNSFLLPIYHENMKKASSILWVSLQQGKLKYQVRRITAEKVTLQPVLLYQDNKNMIAYFRNKNKQSMLFTQSSDMGISWTNVQESSLPNPNSGFDMVRLSPKTYLGVINYSPVERDNLVLVKTNNRGKDWKVIDYLETPILEQKDMRFQTIGRKEHYYQYPSIEYHNGKYHITYTCFNKIKHVIFNNSWLEERE